MGKTRKVETPEERKVRQARERSRNSLAGKSTPRSLNREDGTSKDAPPLVYGNPDRKVIVGEPEVTASRGQNSARRVDLGYVPRHYFQPFHLRSQRFAVIVAHRRCGKTVGSLMDTIHRALKDNSGDGRYAFCGPSYGQVKDIVWGYLRKFTAPLPMTRINEAELAVKLFNGSQIRLYSLESSAYERMRGIYLDGCTIDEYAQCDPRAWPEVIRPALSDRMGWATMIGTSKGRNAFYRLYREALKDPQHWFSARFKASETKIIPELELAAMREMMGPSEYAREMECSFDVEGYDQLVSGAALEEAESRESVRDLGAQIVIGVDVARFGDDRTVLAVREGARLIDGVVWRGQDLMVTAQRVAEFISRYKPRMVFVDGVGVGGGVVDRLKHLGFPRVEDVNVGRKASDPRKYANLRTETYFRMKKWIEDQACFHSGFTMTNDFIEDVTSLTYSYDNQGRLKLDSKEDLKEKGLPSPDVADAVALTFAVMLPTADVERMMSRANYATEVSDPFEAW
jgi:hypothetical protein